VEGGGFGSGIETKLSSGLFGGSDFFTAFSQKRLGTRGAMICTIRVYDIAKDTYHILFVNCCFSSSVLI